MEFAIWSVIVGLLLVVLALSGSVLARLPLSTAMLYLRRLKNQLPAF